MFGKEITPEKLTEQLKQACGDNLLSVVLYGSAASGEFTRKYSNYNLLVVLKNLSLAELKKTSATVEAWVKAGNPPPLMFTLDRLRRSTDVFPIEFMDMKEKHKALFGEDPLEGLEIHAGNLRLELEHELKGKLIQLRENYLLTKGKPALVRDLLIRSCSTFLVLFRSTLRLFGVHPLPPKAQAARALAEKIPFDFEVLHAILRMRDGDKESLRQDPEALLERYIPCIEAVADAVDKWKTYGKN